MISYGWMILRLRQINNGVFVRANASTLKLLRLVEPYITYGYPSFASIKKLMYKRGFLKINGQRIRITDNLIIRQAMKQYDIVCIEDLIHEIYTVGKNFKKVNQMIWPFQLVSARKGLSTKTKKIHFVMGGAYGNREKFINCLISRML